MDGCDARDGIWWSIDKGPVIKALSSGLLISQALCKALHDCSSRAFFGFHSHHEVATNKRPVDMVQAAAPISRVMALQACVRFRGIGWENNAWTHLGENVPMTRSRGK